MAHVRDPFLDLEKHLQQLEEQVDKLVIALDEWRQWKTEYEALQTDVQALPTAATREALSQTRQAFRGELVNDKELTDIFGTNDAKRPHQILSTVSNRLDYVSKNIDTLARQLEAAENKLAATRVVSNPEATDEDGLPITEIMEELDDDDNVVSYNLRRPGDGQQQLLQVLEEAGVKALPSVSSAKPKPDALAAAPADPAESRKAQPKVCKSESPPKSKPEKAPKKKSVAFADDTKPTFEMRLADPDPVKRLEALYRQAKDQESIITDPIMPADESAEDAALREDMIRYNKQTLEYEMGPIVAELNLEEGSDFDEDDWGYDDEDEEDEEDDEDDWGRSTSGVMDDDYRRQMAELRERITQRSLGKKNDRSVDEVSEGIGCISIKQEPAETAETLQGKQNTAPQTQPEQDVKKSVRFATNSDIAEGSEPSTQQVPTRPEKPEVDPLSDVVERNSTTTIKSPPTSKKRASRFKRERANEGPTTPFPTIAPEKPTNTVRYVPSGPEGRTMAPDILEHEPTNEIKEPDEFDASLLHQQVTEEYYKMRNKMINRQGGFLKEDESPIQPLDEDEGGPKRVSRFKAARLAKP